MKPENTKQINKASPTKALYTNSFTDIVKSSNTLIESKPNSPPKRFGGKFKKIFFLVLLFIILATLVGVVIWNTTNKQHNEQISKFDNYFDFFGNKIPQVDCKELTSLAENSKVLIDNKTNYLCYRGSFKVADETMEYASILLTPEFQQEWQKNCSLDCGFSPDDYPAESINESVFIIRGNKKVEYYSDFGGGGLESLLTDLTGCGGGSSFGILDRLNTDGLLIDDNKLGVLSKFSNLSVVDVFGNVCNVDIEFVNYITGDNNRWELVQSVNIKKIAINYDLKDLSSCKTEQPESTYKQCYTVQATLRSDVAICENLASSQTINSMSNGYDECVMAVAKKSRDPLICESIRYYKEQFIPQCKKEVDDYKLAFKGKISIK